MNKNLFKALFWAILIFGLLIRVIPTLGNNFYFTVDQGDDAVHIRGMMETGRIPLKGPETGIKGVYTGPGWYYFIYFGYLLFNGHPYGAVFMLVVLNLATTAVLMLYLKKRVSAKIALAVGFLLQFYWYFYDASRYGFNPFPLVSLAIFEILLMTSFLQGDKRKFYWAIVPVGLAFHFEIAAAGALALFYAAVGLWGIVKNNMPWRMVLVSVAVFPVFFIARAISEFKRDFTQAKILLEYLTNKTGVFSGTNFEYMLGKIMERISFGVVPESVVVGVLIFSLVLYLFLKRRREKSKFERDFVVLTLVLIFISWIWFGGNRGWQDWHTVYLPPLIFISLLLMLFSIPKRFGLVILFLVLFFQGKVFAERFFQYSKHIHDPGLLAHELTVVDWIYAKSEHDGFNVYSFLPTGYDYNYQYLFWWYGRSKYKFVPCEYAVYPGDPKLYIRHADRYSKPQLGCTKFRFLIVESGGDENTRSQWLELARKDTDLVEGTNVGPVGVEKRKLF